MNVALQEDFFTVNLERQIRRTVALLFGRLQFVKGYAGVTIRDFGQINVGVEGRPADRLGRWVSYCFLVYLVPVLALVA